MFCVGNRMTYGLDHEKNTVTLTMTAERTLLAHIGSSSEQIKYEKDFSECAENPDNSHNVNYFILTL